MNFLAIVTFLLFTGLVGLISWIITRNDNLQTNAGYFLGGRSLSGIVIAGSMTMTNLSTEQMVGLNAQGFTSGLSVMAWEATSGLALVLMAIFFLPRYLKGGITTVPEFLEERYDKGTRDIVAGLFLIGLGIIFLPIVLYSGAIAMASLFSFAQLFHISEEAALWVAVWAIGIIGSIYAIFGGLKAVAVSDTLNGIGLLIGGTLIPILGLVALGHGDIFKGISILITNHPEKMNAIGGPTSQAPFSTLFTGMLLINIFYWCTNQLIIQRCFGAKNLAEGQKGVLYTGLLKITWAPFVLVVPGIIAYHLCRDEVLKGDWAYPILVAKVLPNWLVGFFGGVVFGAILSSFNSGLNSAATIFCINVYKPIFKPKIKDDKLIKVGKIFGTYLAILSMIIAPFIAKAPEGLFAFMKKFMGFFNVPTLIIILVGFLSRRVSSIAAKVSIYTFIALYAYLQYIHKVEIHFLHILGGLFVICTIIMLIIGKLWPRETPYIQKDVKAVNLKNWKYLYQFSILGVVSTLMVYTIFSPLGLVNTGKYIVRNVSIIFLLGALVTAVSFIIIKKLEKKKLSRNPA